MPVGVVSETLRHGTLNTIHALRWFKHTLVAVCTWLWSTVLYLSKHKGTKFDLVQRDVQSLEKLPVHLALVVNERPLSHCDLARIVNWCFCVGVQYVSLYDPRGELCVCEGSHVYERNLFEVYPFEHSIPLNVTSIPKSAFDEDYIYVCEHEVAYCPMYACAKI